MVVIRGSGESHRGNAWTESLVSVLIREGFGVLVPDKRGSGASQGDWRTASFVDLAADAVAAVRHLRGRTSVDPDRIGLMGLSQGGQIAPIAAARSDMVAFVINVVGAAIPFVDNLRYEMEHTFLEEGLSEARLEAAMAMVDAALGHVRGEVPWPLYMQELQETRRILEDRLVNRYFIASPDHWRWDFFRRMADFDPVTWWQQVDVPVLVLLGGEDSNTPSLATAERLREVFRRTGVDATVRVFPGLGHALWNMSGPMSSHGLDDDVAEALARWARRVGGEAD